MIRVWIIVFVLSWVSIIYWDRIIRLFSSAIPTKTEKGKSH